MRPVQAQVPAPARVRHARAQLLAGCVALLGGLALAACSWAEAPPLARGNVESHAREASATEIVLGPGDRVSVVVFLHPESSTPAEGVLLGPSGELDLPLLGSVQLGGLSLDEARAKLTSECARFLREPEVSLNLLQLASRRFYVFGEVERPGAIVLDRPLNALEGLSLSGGFRPGADRHQVALLRGNKEQLEVYFFDGATPGVDGMVALQPDDFLFVRLSGAGTFRDQVLPIVQSIVPPITGLASLIVVANNLNN